MQSGIEYQGCSEMYLNVPQSLWALSFCNQNRGFKSSTIDLLELTFSFLSEVLSMLEGFCFQILEWKCFKQTYPFVHLSGRDFDKCSFLP